MFAEVVLVLGHCLHFQDLGVSQQQRDVSEIIHKKLQKSPACTEARGFSFPAMLAEH